MEKKGDMNAVDVNVVDDGVIAALCWAERLI